MSTLAVMDGQVITPTAVLERASVLIEDGRIRTIAPALPDLPSGTATLDAAGLTVAPGFIDVHVHGGAGHDAMDATPKALGAMATYFAAHGVTSFLPTTVAASHEALLAAIGNVAAFMRAPSPGARALGIHLEGPYLSPSHCGAQPPQHIRDPRPAEYGELFARDIVRLISLAPERPGAAELITYAREHGAQVAVGHSAASYDEVLAAVDLGLTQACHTFNGMPALHHREPGAVGAVLTSSRIYAQIIADLIHLHPAVINLVIAAKGIERTILITDAMRAAGLPDGEYTLGEQSVTVRAGRAALTHGDSLAGSTLAMDQALRNVMAATRLSLAEALPMATRVPAAALGLADAVGALMPGAIADLTLLDASAHVRATVVQGRVVYQAAVPRVTTKKAIRKAGSSQEVRA
jgi:N-acetylglucosamine-6-phosphate deacetylase